MSPQEKWIALQTIVIKEVRRFARIWVQTVLPPMVSMALYFVIFGTLIGSRIGEVDGVGYIEFLVPGLILMSVITNSYANVVSSFFGAKFQRHVEELLVSPAPCWLIVSGFVMGGVVRGLSVGVAVTFVAMFFADFGIENVVVVASIVLLTSVVFSIAGFINAVFAETFDDISIIPNFILTPLTYLGGVFYSVSMLPAFWEKVSLFNPVLYMVNAFRYGFYGVSDISLLTAYAIVAGFTVVLFIWAVYLLETGHGTRT